MDEVACKKSQPEAMVMMAPPRAVAEISWLLLFIVVRSSLCLVRDGYKTGSSTGSFGEFGEVG